MPRVQSYGQRTVAPAPLPAARQQAHSTFESEGGQIGQAIAGIGQAAGQVVGQVAQIHKEERDRKIALSKLTYTRQIGETEEALMTAPDTGAMWVTGLDAHEVVAKTIASYDETMSGLAKDLRTPEEQADFAATAAETRLRMTGRLNVHAMQELNAYEKSSADAALVQSINAAVTAAADADTTKRAPGIRAELARQREIIETHGVRMGLASPEERDAAIAKARSDTHAAVITRFIGLDEDIAAQTYFDEVKDQIDGTVRADLEVKLGLASTDGKATRAAGEIWNAHAPQSDLDPISLDVMEADARTRFSDEPKVLRATIATLRDRKQGVDDGRKERADARDDVIYTAMWQGKTFDQVRRTPAFLTADGVTQKKIKDEFEADAARAEAHAYALESRAATREGRLYTAENRKYLAEQRVENQKEINGWGEYFRRSDPAVLRATSRADILRLVPTLGRDHVTRLLTDQEQLSRSDAAVKAVTIDTDMYKDIAFDAGLTYIRLSPGQMSDTERGNAGKLLATVKDAIATQQQTLNRQLTFEEKKAITQGIVDQKVMVSDWFTDSTVIAALVNPDDRAAAYIPIEQITDTLAISQAIATLKATYPALANRSDADIRTRYRTRIEHAYGLSRLGATRQEIDDALRGK